VNEIRRSKEKIKAPKRPVATEDDLYIIVERAANRLGIDPAVAFANAIKFAKLVGIAENSGKLQGENKPQKGKEKSSAKGLYQFVDDSVVPAKNRLERVGLTVSKINPNDMSWEEQTALFLADMLEKDGSDKFMRGVLGSSDSNSMANAYLVLHHTNPGDKKTYERTKEIFYGDIYKDG
jgi:hypothetical protein